MLIKFTGWAIIGYLFGIVGFGIAEFASAIGEMPVVNALGHAFIEGVKWPHTIYVAITTERGRSLR